MKTLSDFADLPDLDKAIFLDGRPAMQLNEQTWTQDGSNNNWYLDIPAAVAQFGEIVAVREDGIKYDEEYSASACHGNSSSYYYDDLNHRLHVHTSGSDDPATLVSGKPKYCLVAFFWKGFGNRPRIIERYTQLLINNIFNYWISSTDIEDWTEVLSGSSTITRSTDVYDDNIELYCAKITIDGSGNAARFRQTISTKPRRKCKVKIRYKAPIGSGVVYIYDSGSNVYLNSSGLWQTSSTTAINLANTSSYTEVEIEFITHASYSDYIINCYSNVANAQVYISEVEFLRYRQPAYFKPLLPPELPTIQQSVGSYIFPENQISVGEMLVNNDGWWWDLEQGDVYLWHNKMMQIRGGSDSWDYEDMPYFFYGLMREPQGKLGTVRFAGYDDRLNLKTLPTNRFDSTTYPNCHADWTDKPIPFVLGGVGNGHIFKPPECNISNYTYKCSDTFGGSYPIYAVSDVWKDGVLQTVTTHYTVNLTNGTITMVSDPGDAEITCRIQGLTNYSPFVSGLAMLPADFLYFILVVLNGINKHSLNLASFKDLYDNRVLGAQEYITEEDSIDIINRLQMTAIFQMFTRLDGTIEARRYRSDVPSDVLRLYNHDFIDWDIVDDTNHTYRELVIQYKPNFATSIYKEMYEDSAVVSLDFDADKIEWEHNIKERLILTTNMETDLQTADLFKNYMNVIEDPIKVLKGTVKNHAALMLNPTDKIKVNLEGNYDGVEKTIYNDQTFQIRHLDKDLNTGNTYLEAFIGWDALYWTIT